MRNESPPNSIAPGALIAGKYRLLHKVGEGAMGAVWAAKNEMTSGNVALKLLHLPDTELRQRFHREARAGALLKHRHILDVYDMGETATGEPFLVMQLLSGETLSSLLKQKRRLDPPIAALIGRDIARALSAAHAVKIVHRDLKPANVFFHHEPCEDEPVVKVLDFGVAKDLSSSDSLRTALGSVVGSLYYMSPEQARAQPDIDHRADIWALGVVLFEMLTGVRPFQGDANKVFASLQNGEIPSVSRYLRRVDPRLVQIVAGCLRRDRDERYASAVEVAKLLNACTAGEEEANKAAAQTRGALPSQPEGEAVLDPDGTTVVLPPRPARSPAVPAPAVVPAETTTAPLPGADPALFPVRGGTIELPDGQAAKLRAAVKQAIEAAEVQAAGRSSTEPLVKAAEAEPEILADDPTKNGKRRKALVAMVAGIVLGVGLCVAGVMVPMPQWGGQTPPKLETTATAIAPAEMPAPAQPPPQEEPSALAAEPPPASKAPAPAPTPSTSTAPAATQGTQLGPPLPQPRPGRDPCANKTGAQLRECRIDAEAERIY